MNHRNQKMLKYPDQIFWKAIQNLSVSRFPTNNPLTVCDLWLLRFLENSKSQNRHFITKIAIPMLNLTPKWMRSGHKSLLQSLAMRFLNVSKVLRYVCTLVYQIGRRAGTLINFEENFSPASRFSWSKKEIPACAFTLAAEMFGVG